MRPRRSRDPSWGTTFGRRFGTSIRVRLLLRLPELLISRLRALEDECMPVWDVERQARTDGRGTRSDWLGTKPPYTPPAARAVLWGTKCPRAQTLERLSSLIMAWIRT